MIIKSTITKRTIAGKKVVETIYIYIYIYKHQKRQIWRETETERQREYWPFYSEQLGRNRGEVEMKLKKFIRNQVGRVRVEANERFKKVKP